MRMRARGIAAIVAGMALAGCGSRLAPVAGLVTLDGNPLPRAHVVLTPQDRSAEGPFVADTDAEGRFSLGPIGKPSEGVPPGRYRLSISTAFSMDSDAPPPKELVPSPYTGGVDYEVPPAGDARASFELHSGKMPR
jgi:hypothetical protein